MADYCQPWDQPDNPTAPYVDLNEAMGVDGSVPPARFFNAWQEELLDLIRYAGLTPSHLDRTQIRQAILALMPHPTGAPSDASLVHFGIDDGAANSVVLTVSPTAAGVAPGFAAFFRPAATNSGASTLTVNLTPSGSAAKSLLRSDGAPLQPGDLRLGQLACAVCASESEFRLAWLHNRGVVADGVTIFGAGVESDPLIAARSGFGVEIGQSVHVVVHIAGSYANPAQAGFARGQIYPAAALTTGVFGSAINGNLIGVFPVNASANTGSAAPWPAPACAVEGNLVGNWRLVGWQVTSGVIGITAYTLVFRRVN